MWGNKFGWVISALIVLLDAAGMYLLAESYGATPPTAAFVNHAAYFQPLKLPVNPLTVVKVTLRDCDSGDLYRAALADFNDHPDAYDRKRGFDYKSDVVPAAFTDILKGGECTKMSFLAKDPGKWINYLPDVQDAMSGLDTITTDMFLRAAILRGTGHVDEARAYWNAVFMLGVKLFDERLRWEEADEGLGLMGKAVAYLKSEAKDSGDAARVQMLEDFSQKRADYYINVLQPLMKLTHDFQSDHPGDVYYLIQHAQDRMWRIEGLLHLGRIRHNVGDDARKGDQTYAPKFAARIMADPTEDPVVKIAAQHAHDITDAEYNAEPK